MQTLSIPLATATDLQHDEIYEAFQRAHKEGWLSRHEGPETEILALQPSFTPEEEWVALEILSKARVRPKLQKLGIEFPTKASYQHRLTVKADADGWLVQNLTRGTEYRVTPRGFALDCTCDEYGNGYCKHRDAVEAFRTQAPQWIDDTDPVAAMAEVMGDEPEKLPTYKPASDPETIAQGLREGWIVPSTPKELPELIPGFTPTPDQWAALELLKAWWSDSTEPFFRLQGYAGTGKSTIIQAFILWLRQQRGRVWQVGFAAPTNKAAKVQARMLAKWNLDGIEPITCAKLFAIKEQKQEGKQVFVRDRNAEPAVDLFDLVVVDECSMISEDLWGYFLEESSPLSDRPHRFILMGDPAQLPPVGEPESMTFRWDCPGVELTQVMRYDGAIGLMADQIRRNLDSPILLTFTTDNEDGRGIWALSRDDWEATMLAAFASDGYAQDPNYCRVLAWRNRRVNYLNDKIRRQLGHRGDYALGERLIASEPFVIGRQVIVGNSEEMEVTDIRQGHIGDWLCWYLSLEMEDGRSVMNVPVLQKSQEVLFNRRQEALAKDRQWGKFWANREQFAWLNYAYALTVHKSQGSTFTHGFVDIADIAQDRSRHQRAMDGTWVFERNQLAYVAATRFSDRLFVMQ